MKIFSLGLVLFTLAEPNSSMARPAVSQPYSLRAWPLQDSPYPEGLFEHFSVSDLDSSPDRKVKGLTETHDKSSRPVAGSARSEDPSSSTSREVKGLSENHDESSDPPVTSTKLEDGLLFRFLKWRMSFGYEDHYWPFNSSEMKRTWLWD